MSEIFNYLIRRRDPESEVIDREPLSLNAEFSPAKLAELQAVAVDVSKGAAKRLMAVYESDLDLGTELKDDDSPVTKADRVADEYLIAEFEKRTAYPVVTEETQRTFEERQNFSAYWLIDPLDGTQNFINRDGEFCIAIAFVVDSIPVIGVIDVPAQDTVFMAYRGGGAVKRVAGVDQPISHRYLERSLLVVDSKLPSDSGKCLTEQFCTRSEIPLENVRRVGSAYKLGLLATGDYDVAVRFDPMGEWDVAAADCILREAGCFLVDIATNESIPYNQRPTLMLQGYLASRVDLEFDTGTFETGA